MSNERRGPAEPGGAGGDAVKGRRAALALLAVLVAIPWVCGGERQRLGKPERQRLPGLFVELKDGVTRCELQGAPGSELVVFVHGFSSPSYVWGPLPRALRDEGYATLAYDLYGRGLSDRPWARYDLDLFDRQLERLLRRLGATRPVHLVGLSMGGIIATEFALRHPERVATLTLVDPAGIAVSEPVAARLLEIPLVGDWLMQVFGDRVLLGANARSVHDQAHVPELERRFRQQLEYAGYKRAILSTLRHMPLSDFRERYAALARTGLPVEVFWGADDEITPVAGAKIAAGLLPEAAVHVIEDAGHLAHYERPQEVLREMFRFLADHPAPGQRALRVPKGKGAGRDR